jgi:hypothetical protein
MTTQAHFALRDLRDRQVTALSKRFGVQVSHLDRWITGQRRPAPWIARELAAALGVKPHDIWNGVQW